MAIDSLKEVMRRVKGIEHQEIRVDSEARLEIVFSLEALEIAKPIFQDYFGPALKPAGVNATKEAVQLSEKYGGIQKDQALYFVERGGISSLVMIWPWQDGKRATVKIIREGR